jgi:hypothetical protein
VPGLTFKRLDGVIGCVVIPEIGLEIGTMANWSLVRREETPPELGEWNLHAVFSFVNEYAFNTEEWHKEFRITLGSKRKGKEYRLVPTSGRTVLTGRSLLVEAVRMENVDLEADGRVRNASYHGS